MSDATSARPPASMPETPTQVDVHQVDVDNVMVKNPIRSNSAQTWIALTPVLSVLITAVSLVITFGFQILQTREASLDKQDADWRSALEHLSMNESGATTGVFEMQSFLDNPRYGEEASSLSTTLLPIIPDKKQFDAAYFTLIRHERLGKHKDFISVDRTLSDELRDRWDYAKAHEPGKNLSDTSLQHFIADPSQFYNGETQVMEAERTNSVIWKLDSTAGGLSALWSEKAPPSDEEDLTGLIFLNADFRTVDFSKSDLHEALFIGTCKVKPNWKPDGAEIDCLSPRK